jgi:hypothetical protein
MYRFVAIGANILFMTTFWTFVMRNRTADLKAYNLQRRSYRIEKLNWRIVVCIIQINSSSHNIFSTVMAINILFAIENKPFKEMNFPK